MCITISINLKNQNDLLGIKRVAWSYFFIFKNNDIYADSLCL